MHKSPADLAYDELTAHYHGCASCTVRKDCAVGHGLFMTWGALECAESPDDWWKVSAERAAIQREPYPYLPDPGERTP